MANNHNKILNANIDKETNADYQNYKTTSSPALFLNDIISYEIRCRDTNNNYIDVSGYNTYLLGVNNSYVYGTNNLVTTTSCDISNAASGIIIFDLDLSETTNSNNIKQYLSNSASRSSVMGIWASNGGNDNHLLCQTSVNIKNIIGNPNDYIEDISSSSSSSMEYSSSSSSSISSSSSDSSESSSSSSLDDSSMSSNDYSESSSSSSIDSSSSDSSDNNDYYVFSGFGSTIVNTSYYPDPVEIINGKSVYYSAGGVLSLWWNPGGQGWICEHHESPFEYFYSNDDEDITLGYWGIIDGTLPIGTVTRMFP